MGECCVCVVIWFFAAAALPLLSFRCLQVDRLLASYLVYIRRRRDGCCCVLRRPVNPIFLVRTWLSPLRNTFTQYLNEPTHKTKPVNVAFIVGIGISY